MIACYALLRKQRPDLFLSPYPDVERIGDLDPEQPVVLNASEMLSKDKSDAASFSLYRDIDFAVDRWIQNRQYVPRLLFCALTFLLCYFFFSLVVRDPIPIVDELFFSSVLTIMLWVWLSHRDTRSSLALRRRYELKQQAGSCEDRVEEGLFSLETYLEDISHLDALDVCHALCRVGDATLPPLDIEHEGPWLAHVKSLLALNVSTYDRNLLRMYRKVRDVRSHDREDRRLARRLFHLSMQQKLDIPLLALLTSLDVS